MSLFRMTLGRILCALSLSLAALGADAAAQTLKSQTPPPVAAIPPPAPPPHDQANASFWSRFDNIGPNPLNPPLSWYQPLGALAGNPGPFIPFEQPGRHAFSEEVTTEATSFADDTGGDALLVAHGGLLAIEHYAAGTAAPPDHLFSAHSMTRGLGAVAIGILIDRGQIKSVDEPAADFIFEWRHDPRQAITIRQLLTMSSGIRSTPSMAPGSTFIQSYYGADVERIVANTPLVTEPGKTFFYDTQNNHALGLIIERASGMRYLDFVSTAIWQKLGAANARMMLDHPGGRAMAYCCMLATPRDWLRVGEMLRNGGTWNGQRIVSAAWVNQMRTPSSANPNFGFQLFLGPAWMNPDINRQAPKQRSTLEPVHAPDAFYLAGAGDINLMVIPSQALTILRTGRASPFYRFHVVPNLLIDALVGNSPPGAWATLLAYRKALPKFGLNPTLANASLSYWPFVRVAGAAHPIALPRKTLACQRAGAFEAIDRALGAKPDYALIVFRKDAIVHESYGGSYDANTLGESASMHKSVLALLVGRIAAEGKIRNTDQPVSTWLREWANDPRGRITLRDLLQMASGLKPVPFDLSPTGLTEAYLKGPDIEQLVLALQYDGPPGKVFEYFSQISSLIAIIVERATGQRYADLLSKELWAGIGAGDAYVTLDRPGGLARTAASLLAKPEDWVRVGQLFLNDGIVAGHRLIDRTWLAQMTSPSASNPNYGYQIWRASPYRAVRSYSTTNPVFTVPAREPFLAADTVYFDGAVGRRVYISKANGTIIVRLGDTDLGWEDSWLPNAVFRALDQCATGTQHARSNSTQ